MCVTFHVEVDESAKLARATENWSQLGCEMRNSVSRIGRSHLRIKRGDFDGEIYDRKQFGILSHWIGPAFCFPGEHLEKIEATRGVFGRLLFADHGLTEEIDREADALLVPFAQHLHDIARIFSGDELPGHPGHIPAQDLPA